MDTYTLEQEMADEAAAGPYLGYYATADAEAHYLFTAGFVAYCSCNACELANEGAYAEAEERYEYEAWLDDEATVEQIENEAQVLFDWSVEQAERAAGNVDPWGEPVTHLGWDEAPF